VHDGGRGSRIIIFPAYMVRGRGLPPELKNNTATRLRLSHQVQLHARLEAGVGQQLAHIHE
jgi:hypothetical protein